MRVLLDTCVISEMRKQIISSALKEILDGIKEDDLYLSAITVGELIKGISLLDEGRRKKELWTWINGLENDFADRILEIDAETAHIWGEVTAKAQKEGKNIPACDGLIAATALKNGLHLLTRNSDDFIATGVLVINPWKV